MMKLSMVEQGKKLESVVELSRYFTRIKQNLWRIILVAVVTAAVMYPLVRMITAKYVATSVVMLKPQQDDAAPVTPLNHYDPTRNDYYETQYTIAASRVVLARAVTELGLDTDPAFNGGIAPAQCSAENARQRQASALKALDNGTTVSGVRNTQLIDFSFESADALVAARVANGLAQAYINNAVEQKRQALVQAQQWNQQQMDTLRKQMDAQKAQIDAYLKKEGLLTFRGVDGYETEELGIVTNRLANATERRVGAESLNDQVKQALATHSLEELVSIPKFSDHSQIQDLRISLTLARQNLAELSKRYGPKHDKIREAQAKLNTVNRQIGQVLAELARGTEQQYQAALDDEARYQAMLDGQKNNFQQLASKRDKYNSMMTALTKTQDLYQAIYQRAHEQALAVSMDQADALISDPAVAPERPAKPNKPLLLIIAVVLVTLLYLVWLIVNTALDNTISSMSQLSRRIKLVALGEIPAFTGEQDPPGLVKRIFSDPLNADIIYGIRTNLLLADTAPQVVVVASAGGREGRSLVARALATSFSTDQATLLIDMDYMNDNGLSVGHDTGLAEVIQGNRRVDDALVTLGDNLFLLPRGRVSGSTFLMFTSRHMAELLETLRGRFQRIIIDVPAFGQSQDGQLIGRLADRVLLVVQADHTQAMPVLKMIATLEENKNTLAGAVLNRVREPNLESKEGLRWFNSQLKALNIPGNKRKFRLGKRA